MKLTALRPILYTSSLEETIEFYTDILGFSLGEKNDEWGWASLSHGEVEIMLAKPNTHTPFEKALFTGSFYFTTDDVDSLWEKIKDRVAACYAPEVFDWGMYEFGIYDNNGYLLQFGQDVPSR